jgi:hypothetical protein
MQRDDAVEGKHIAHDVAAYTSYYTNCDTTDNVKKKQQR